MLAREWVDEVVHFNSLLAMSKMDSSLLESPFVVIMKKKKVVFTSPMGATLKFVCSWHY